ncbi:hypothetical protein CF319_g9225 [Tilletia indica]|nr:hypothetical protein CF319_g9225 [Tilletia indica]
MGARPNIRPPVVASSSGPALTLKPQAKNRHSAIGTPVAEEAEDLGEADDAELQGILDEVAPMRGADVEEEEEEEREAGNEETAEDHGSEDETRTVPKDVSTKKTDGKAQVHRPQNKPAASTPSNGPHIARRSASVATPIKKGPTTMVDAMMAIEDRRQKQTTERDLSSAKRAEDLRQAVAADDKAKWMGDQSLQWAKLQGNETQRTQRRSEKEEREERRAHEREMDRRRRDKELDLETKREDRERDRQDSEREDRKDERRQRDISAESAAQRWQR